MEMNGSLDTYFAVNSRYYAENLFWFSLISCLECFLKKSCQRYYVESILEKKQNLVSKQTCLHLFLLLVYSYVADS